jgi:hypothetical protein
MTLATATPTTVPVMPVYDAAIAPVTAASMLAMTWVALSSIRRPLTLSPPVIAAFRDGCDLDSGARQPSTRAYVAGPAYLTGRKGNSQPPAIPGGRVTVGR